MAIGQIVGNVFVVGDLDSFDRPGWTSSVEIGKPCSASAVGGENVDRMPAPDQSAGQFERASRLAAVLPCGKEIRNDERNLHTA